MITKKALLNRNYKSFSYLNEEEEDKEAKDTRPTQLEENKTDIERSGSEKLSARSRATPHPRRRIKNPRYWKSKRMESRYPKSWVNRFSR